MILAPTPEHLEEAGKALREGRLVVLPTETVYGLAANALDADAVRRVFEAKGRPPDHPLIVHVASLDAARGVSSRFPSSAAFLGAKFWPGPLSVVVPRADVVPDATTGGLATVAIRVPAHPVCLAVLRAAGVPLAMPSANRFGRLSATRAQDVDPDIVTAAAMLIDGGPGRYGIESTVVDCTVEPPRILRPGAVARSDVEAAIGELGAGSAPERRSPGMHPAHYAPRARLRLVDRLDGRPGLALRSLAGEGQIQMPDDPGAYAALLYRALHELDRLGLPEAFVEEPPSTPDWEAVRDRLRRAAHG